MWGPGFTFRAGAGCVCHVHTAAFKKLEVEHFEGAVGRGLVFEFDIAKSVRVFVSFREQKKEERKRKEKLRRGEITLCSSLCHL